VKVVSPEGMEFVGGKTIAVGGGATGAEECELVVGKNDKDVPYAAYLVQLDELELKHLMMDSRLWVIQWGLPIHPHSFDVAFVSPDAPDGEVTKGLQALGALLADAWTHHGNGDPEGQLRKILIQIGAQADQAEAAAAVSGKHIGLGG
jgi:hypothetical protein